MSHRMRMCLATLCIPVIAAWFSVTWDTHRAAERPVQSTITVLFLCGAILLTRSRFCFVTENPSQSGRRRSPSAVRRDSEEDGSNRLPLRRRSSEVLIWQQSLDRHTRQTLLKLVIASIVLRVGTLWLIARDIRCSKKAVEAILLPCLIVIHELTTGGRLKNNDQDADAISRNIYEDLYHTFSYSVARYLLPTVLLCFGVSQTSMHSFQSTYICSTMTGVISLVFIAQVIGTALDAVIIVVTWRFLKELPDDKQKLVTLGLVSTSSAIISAALGVAISFWTWGSLSYMSQFSMAYIWSLVRDSIACVFFVLCVIYTSSQSGLSYLIFNITCCCVSAPLILSAWSSRNSFPPQSNSGKSIGMLCIFAGYLLSMSTHGSKTVRTSPVSPKYLSVVISLLLTIFFVVTEAFFLVRSNDVDEHPIYNLMYEARIEGDRWLKAASPSASLPRAILEYRTRHHGRDPPPNFDKWYTYALQKGSLILDNYDSIDRDLLPFWSMEPAEIRRLTPKTFNSTDAMNGIVSIAIRNGQAAPMINETLNNEDVIKILAMINEFAKWLPDLEIAVNTRRQPRVSIPWEKIQPMRKLGSKSLKQKQPGTENVDFPASSQEKWSLKLKEVDGSKKRNVKPWMPFMPSIFDKKVGPSCPPFSRARRNRGWNPQEFCATCAAPHSDGPFVKNWTIAADLCNQPDMANIHGFFTGETIVSLDEPPNDTLQPIFSRSKITGYNDILFPFPGDYVDSQTPHLSDKGFYEKDDKLFWRGALSSEGVSFNHQWQGMQQQRLVHLVTNTSPIRLISILSPSTKEGKFTYENVPAAELKPMLEKFDIGFTNNMPCLNDLDCHEQVREFGTRDSVDFSEYDNHRYLFSLDKNGGSSPDLVTFLQSRSVPFHTSIFRSWFDDRLTPWLHFVPQDGRLQAVHSTLAYFVGLKTKINGREVQMNNKPAQAAFIADQGRKWANLALRKEDASVYAFRLLLEYSRVVDDQRNDIGYVGEETSPPQGL